MENVLTTDQIRSAKPSGKMTQDYSNGIHKIIFDNGVVFNTTSSKSNNKLWNKLLKMGFDRHYNIQSDETDGLVQAAENGENPFAFSVICADPSQNGIFK